MALIVFTKFYSLEEWPASLAQLGREKKRRRRSFLLGEEDEQLWMLGQAGPTIKIKNDHYRLLQYAPNYNVFLGSVYPPKKQLDIADGY